MTIQLRKKQSGAVLIVGLIVVMVLSVVVIAASKSTLMQLKMSGNLRDKDIAFQSAESSLIEAENFLSGQTENALKAQVFDGVTDGLYNFQINRALSKEDDWTSLNTKISDNSLFQTYQKSEYIIEQMTNITPAGNSLLAGKPVEGLYYRVTTKAKGGTDSSLAILQTIYKK